MLRSPGGCVQRRAVPGDVKIAVTFLVARLNINSEVEEGIVNNSRLLRVVGSDINRDGPYVQRDGFFSFESGTTIRI
jgi:hypothetical protein